MPIYSADHPRPSLSNPTVDYKQDIPDL